MFSLIRNDLRSLARLMRHGMTGSFAGTAFMHRQIAATLALMASSAAWAAQPLGTPLGSSVLGVVMGGFTTLGLPVTGGGILVAGAAALALGIRIARRKRK